MTERQQFTFYRSYYEAIKALPKPHQTAVLLAVCGYALDEIEPALTGTDAAIFSLIKPTLDAGKRKAENAKAKSKTEQTGSKKNQTAKEKEKEGEKEREIEKEVEKEVEIEKEHENENDSSLVLSECIKADKPPSAKRFTPPTADDVRAYCQEKGLELDAERFVDYYASRGWMVGKSRMKDWRAAARNWAREDAQKPSTGKRDVSAGIIGHDMKPSREELEKLQRMAAKIRGE